MIKNKVITLLIIIVLIFFAYTYKNKSDENELVSCIKQVTISLKIDSLKVDATNRVDSPIISGKTSSKDKKKFKQLIADKCLIQSFEDLIIEENDFDIKFANINFKLDGFNKIGTITGMVNSAIEQQEILSSFTDAVNKYYGPWTIHHDIIVSKAVDKSEFSIDISLVFSAISLVRVTDITLTNTQITVKGLVRSKDKLDQTITQLQQIFQNDLEIINQLEPVVKDGDEVNGFEIELAPLKLPEIKPPINN